MLRQGMLAITKSWWFTKLYRRGARSAQRMLLLSSAGNKVNFTSIPVIIVAE